MAQRVCPPIFGWWLLNPLRKLREHPDKILGPLVRDGMTVVEPGPAMGYFTLPLARMVGAGGKVIAVDVQQKMLDRLARRADKAGLADRIETRLVHGSNLGLSDLKGRVDFAAAIHVVHEVPDPGAFFGDLHAALKPGARLLIIEPRGHVKPAAFEESMRHATSAGFARTDGPPGIRGPSALLHKADAKPGPA